MKRNNQSCPVSFATINQAKVRLVAFFVFVLAAIYCAYPHWSIAGILLVDFTCRAFKMGRYSIFGNLADGIIAAFSLPQKPVNAAAKEFAAVLGFILCDVLFIISALQLYDVGIYVAAVLLCFSFLEAAFGVCIGCYVYPYFRKMIITDSNDDMLSA